MTTATPVNSLREDLRVSFRDDVLLSSSNRSLSRHPRDRLASVDSSKSGSSSSHKYTELRGSLTREHVNRDPLFFYEVTKVLGQGSMGAVKLVRKRSNRIGGSARIEFQEAVKRQKQEVECLKIPIVGGMFQFCIDGSLKDSTPVPSDRSEKSASSTSVGSTWSKIFNGKENLLSGGLDSDRLQPSESGISASSSTMEYAMKSIVLSHVAQQEFIDELRNEIAILKSLDHPHVVRAIETFEHKKEIFIIMEVCSGGDLYSRDPYTEAEAARITGSILSAVSYMHSRNITHRDLKYENVLFVSTDPRSEIKLIDFGLSKKYGESQLTDGVGTIYTMAPEVLKGKYTEKADLWSIGVIAYMLLSSQLPFYGKKRQQIMKKILEGSYDFKGRRWKKISKQAQQFIEDLLVLDPDQRVDADTAMGSLWLNQRYAATTRAPLAQEEDLARAAMIQYAGYNKLKKMALMVVAHKSSTEEIGILRKVFQKYDSRRDGSISFPEFCDAMKGFGHSEEDLQEVFDAVDLDGTGRIRYTEFLAATIEARGAISEERLAEAFDRLDSDDSGYISAENLVEILGKDVPREEIEQIIAEADLTKDNQISYREFLALWEMKQESDREISKELLGTQLVQDMLQSVGSNISLESFDTADREASEAHAEFLAEKHTQRHIDVN